uniref:G-protein coupled receptors family 1 profile domain-containing protein n=1 Tax=Sus scrofa TaxID=9823 RepID=A0A8D1DG14_PIG
MFTYGSLFPPASWTWGHPWQLQHPLCDQDGALTPCAHVPPPLPAGCLGSGAVPLIPPHYAEDLCFQCYSNSPQCLLCSRILYPWSHRSGVLGAPAHVFGPLFGHIRNPLRYSSILTNARVAKTGLAFLTKSMLLVLRFPFTLKRWTYCRKSLLSHSYCLHQDVMKLACSDNTVSFFYGFLAALCMMTDGGFTAVSCVFILQTVMGTGSHKERLKALNTCVSHICAVLIFYVPIIALASVHRFGSHKPPGAMSLIADIFLLVPPLMNPIVYCVKTRQIREKVLGKLGLK